MSTDADLIFATGFNNKYGDLQRALSSPSSDLTTLTQPGLEALLAGQPVTSKASCDPCRKLAKPPACVKNGLGGGKGKMSWLICLLMIVAIFVVMYGLAQMFGNSSERQRKRHRPYSAPHIQPEQPVYMGAQQAGGGGEAVTDEEDPDRILPGAADGLVFVFFHATWCGHCKQLRPLFEQAANSSRGKALFKAVVSDVLQKSKDADKVPIRGFPTIVVFANGEKVDEMVGNQGMEKLQALIAKHAR